MVNDKPTVYNTSSVYKEAGGGGGGGLPDGYLQYTIIRNKVSFNGVETGIILNISGENKQNYTYGVKFVNKLLEHNYNQVARLFKTSGSPFCGIHLDDTNFKFSNGGVVGTTSNNLPKNISEVGVKDNRLYNLTTNTTIGGTVNYVSVNYTNITLLGNPETSKNVPVNAEEILNFFVLNETNDKIIDCIPAKEIDTNKIGVFDIIAQKFWPAANQSNYEVI